jgi:LytS/YehU family sensor histidine kinase
VKICEPLAGVRPKAFETYTEIFTDIPKLIYVYFFQIMAAAFVFVFFKTFKDQFEIQKRALQLEKDKAETELKLLKTQLNPHFLFNTLNNIYSLSLEHSSATSPAIARLADILDYVLYRCDQTLVPLGGEIALLNNYIGLEKLRYDDRLKVDLKTNIEHDIKIAPLILLSLTENAFKHGAADDTGTPEIVLDLEVKEKQFTFMISNSVAKSKYEVNGSVTSGIGLNNLRQQLQLIYGEDFNLETTHRDNYFIVTLNIDLKPEKTYEKDSVLIG